MWCIYNYREDGLNQSEYYWWAMLRSDNGVLAVSDKDMKIAYCEKFLNIEFACGRSFCFGQIISGVPGLIDTEMVSGVPHLTTDLVNQITV